MPETVLTRGEVSAHVPQGPWMLVFGGVTREGNRRARAATDVSAGMGLPVVWFDGYREGFDGQPETRVALDMTDSNTQVLIVDYSEDEKSHWVNRMVDSIPTMLLRPLQATEGRFQSGFLRRLHSALGRAIRAFRKSVLRRISQIFRGAVGWSLVKNDVNAIAKLVSPPVQIVYGDDFAFTQAWHAVRIWPEVEAGMRVRES
jgi:hypothetical protein